jgi:8-oxo-dGTP pyrophosphatase MutT (NUDIX family)
MTKENSGSPLGGTGPAEGRTPPATVPAATLILVRDGATGLETYLLRRSQKSGFMAGNYVFPGGLVDPLDRETEFWSGHADLAPVELAGRMGRGLGAEETLAYAVAAVRETFEEAGALFAGSRQAVDGELEKLCALRGGRRLSRGWLKDLLASGNWRLELKALAPWAHWITPLLMPKRFDTRFFTAVLPGGQECRPDEHETMEGIWLNPREALIRNHGGSVPLSPPTVVTLQAMLAYPDSKSLLAAAYTRGWGAPVFPRQILLDKPYGSLILEPWDPMYAEESYVPDPAGLERCLLPVGAAFSRIWHRNGIWRPVSPDPL